MLIAWGMIEEFFPLFVFVLFCFVLFCFVLFCFFLGGGERENHMVFRGYGKGIRHHHEEYEGGV